jgi:2-dehydropantoate 2-reductase
MGERILVWGAGAIGGTVGAYLWRAGHDVTFVDASPDHIAAIRREGLRIVGPVDQFRCTAPAFLPQDVDGKWPIVALAVKAQHTEAACAQLRPHLAESGYVLSLQNGLCETVIEKTMGRARTMGALVGFMGDQLAPGEIRFGQRAKFCVGELDGRISDRAVALGRLMADFEPNVEVTGDIWGYLWGKLGFVALLYGTALGNSTLVELFSAGSLQTVWRGLAGEIVAVAASEGVVPRGFDGFEPAAFAADATAEHASRSMNAMANLLRGSPKTHSGMWRDIAIHHRPTEIGNQIGPVIEIGLRNGIPTPVLRRLMTLIRSVETGDLAQSDALISELLPTGPGGFACSASGIGIGSEAMP